MPRRTVQVMIRMPEETRRDLKVEAARRGMTMSMIVLEALATRVVFVGKRDGAPPAATSSPSG